MTPEEMKAHRDGVIKMYKQIKPIIEDCDDRAVVFGTLLITLSACGSQLDMPTEHFKALVVQELDRLMLMDAKPEGLLS
jgi:hypothetical protein